MRSIGFSYFTGVGLGPFPIFRFCDWYRGIDRHAGALKLLHQLGKSKSDKNKTK